MEEKNKLKAKRKQILEDEQRQQKYEKENEDNVKIQAIAERKKLEERARIRKEEENNLRLEALKLEAKRIIKEEEEWRTKINQEYALKMGYKIDNSNNQTLSIIPNILNNGDEKTIGKTGKQRFIQYTNKVLKEIKQNNQVFDPGNLMKQIINRELNISQNRQVKLNI